MSKNIQDFRNFEYYKNELHSLVKKRGLKYSLQREEILKILYKAKEHLSPEEILYKVKKSQKNIGLATVYRALSFLEKEGLINSISFGVEGKKYELNRGSHHDHMICLECGKIIEFFDEELELLQEKIAKKFGFKIVSHDMNLYGICKECSKEKKES
ncbi:Fur family transcriptional regulator [Nitrosophilus alvini]|uniref:Fur family transcriptional regulator n=1 Tax=Nitrosophilus alvini TaxID=2714855 RepID=UPI001909F323|nr:Fur family transcriptional regulator [Nitrosophilus alvini]